MAKPLAVILMGSRTDLEHCQKIADACKSYGIEVIMRIGSAHKTPEFVLKLLKEYEADPRPKVYITAAGRSNALSGFTDGAVSAPVIACPPPSEAYGGADVYSSLRMPAGIAPAVVLEPVNAALLAAKMLGLADMEVHAAVVHAQKQNSHKVIEDDRKIQ
jgi:5-(carboxyamino)imidazole ribonucleotide mutase